MQKSRLFRLCHLIFYFCFLPCHLLQAYDLTVVGIMNYADGLGRIPVGIIDTIKDDISINFVPIGDIYTLNLGEEIQKIAFYPDKAPGKVSLLTVPVLWSEQFLFYQSVPQSRIKIAYSMFESTRIPPRWVKIFNAGFDAVVVPDSCLVKVYKDSGVKIPIFVLPLGMYLDDFLQKDPHAYPLGTFVFGGSAAYTPHKNVSLMIQAFAEEFGNSNEAILVIHGRLGGVERFQNYVRDLGVSNIVFSYGSLEQEEYIEMMNSFDCYVNISKGEGFSCCPREALALGIPCILSNNSAQKTLCRAGFVKSVTSNIEEPAVYGTEYYDSQPVGNQFNCDIGDVRQAMRDVFTHYEHYLQLARSGREWVSQYSWNRLKLRYLNLIKPKKVILGSKNVITDKYLMTDSPSLYIKYKSLQVSR
jgi:glycosyltransferase involved in cell wall biosynthesis